MLSLEMIGTDFKSVKPRMIDSEMGNPLGKFTSIQQMVMEMEALKKKNSDLMAQLAAKNSKESSGMELTLGPKDITHSDNTAPAGQ